MSAPIGHLVIALAALTSGIFNHHEDKLFLVGTNFPDIKKMGVTAEVEPHDKELDWNDVLSEQDSFMAGLKLHCFVDIDREQYYRTNGIWDLLPDGFKKGHLLKITEDMVLAETIDNWDSFLHYYDHFPVEGRRFGISDEDLAQWKGIISGYIGNMREARHAQRGASDELRMQMMYAALGKKSYRTQELKDMVATAQELAKNENLRALIIDYYYGFMNRMLKS